jgi:nucleotide-binding universal stress UspA family protein
MFDNVVVGADGDQAGRDALELAKQLASTDGNLLLVYVQVVMAPPDPGEDPEWQVAERRRALERLASLGVEARVDAELLAVQAGSVAAGLHGAAGAHGDVLVIGASRRDDFERAFVGDDTRQVLEDSPYPVAVAPVGYAKRQRAPFRKIGVAYDGSPQSERALALARRLARERHAELAAFEAVPEPAFVHDPTNYEPEVVEGVERARKQLAELGDVESHVASGDAAEALARYAASVDLLVLGSHEYRPIDRVTGGSTAQQLAGSSQCPLLVLSPPDRE